MFLKCKQFCSQLATKGQPLPLPKYYTEFNATQPKSYYEYDKYNLEIGHQDDYEIYTKIGQGKYSEVFFGNNILNHTPVALKVLKPNQIAKLKREVLILKNLVGHQNIIELQDLVQDFGSQRYTLVFDWQDLLTLPKIKYLLKEILTALDYAHSRGIIHRDIKPQNILTDKEFSYVKIIDWGLGEFYHPLHEYNVRVASRYFKAPEILLDCKQYHYSLDSWSVGCVMAGMIFLKEPFFQGSSNDDQLVKINQIVGYKALQTYMKECNIKLPIRYNSLLNQNATKKPLEMFVNENNEQFCTPEALDLLEQLLTVNHVDRILPKDALNHKFFE